MSKTYVVVLGGTGFDEDSPRLWAAVRFAITTEPEAILVTCGMGRKMTPCWEEQYEHEFLADWAVHYGISRKRILQVESNPDNRSHQNEILHVWNTIPWMVYEESPTVIFVTEGVLHAFRVKRYALLQRWPLRSDEVICLDSGERITWGRRFKELRSLFKFFKWRLTRRN